MIEPTPHEISERQIAEARQVLAHFYDHIYLSQHPLIRRCRGVLGEDTRVAVRKLRRTLVQILETLRPPDEIGEEDPMWRPYMVLHSRYVLGKEIEEVERELGLGTRQIQREQRRGLEAVAQMIAERLHDCEDRGDCEDSVAHGTASTLSSDIRLVASEQEVFSVAVQLGRALVAVEPLAQAHGVTFVQERDADSPHIVGSPSALRQLFVLLLSLLARSGISRTYLVRLCQSDTDVCCSFLPTAMLTPTDELPTILLPSIATALAEALQAELVVNPPAPEGRRSLIDLIMQASRRSYSVLLVEDNADVVALFTRYMMSEGFRCIAATDSAEAYDRIVEYRPDAIVLDVMMRKMDGWELLQRIKTDPSHRDIPVVICSVLDEQELATSLGADAYLRKPVRPAELIECLLKLCRSHSA